MAGGSQAPLFYLSFQRPPPACVAPGAAVGVSPLICSDLRDVVHTPADEPLRLRLQWVVLQRGQLRAVPAQQPLEISWSGPQDAYRVTTITAPAGRIDGELHLAMWAERRPAAHKRRRNGEASLSQQLCTSLSAQHDAEGEQEALPIPVVTGPIRVGRGAGNDKVDVTSRLFSLDGGDASGVLEIREQTGFALDKHVWDAAMHLSRLLAQVLMGTAAEVKAEGSELERRAQGRLQSICQTSKLRVVELGAGTAMLSIMLSVMWAKMRHRSSPAPDDDETAHAEVECWATDLEPALSLIDSNISLNSASLASSDGRSVSIRPLLLDWDAEELPQELKRPDAPAADVVLASDCTYNPSSFPALARTIARLLSGPSSSDKTSAPFALLAKKHRHIDEEALWEILAAHKLDNTLIAGCAPPEDADADYEGWGIWLLTLEAT